MKFFRSTICLAMALGHAHADTFEDAARLKNTGNVQAVYDLLDRVNPGSKDHFTLSLSESCPSASPPCFHLADGADGKVEITGTSASEVTFGVGVYMREYCNMTIGWKRGGGSNVFTPTSWPTIGAGGDSRRRNTPWSYIMNVCTHSYSLVWYGWSDWEEFIDWMSLSGINLFLAMTGQEEVQYKVLEKFGLSDSDIRQWFNGPALLTWSRGQNEYGADIAGPLPRSWMKQQWGMQKQILNRTRSLGMSGQLPGFQGNVPVQLRAIANDTNMTKAGDTAWMNSVDPLYAKIADEWMRTLLADFGTDHWYQLDGYFNGGTAPWLNGKEAKLAMDESLSYPAAPPTAPCEFSNAIPDTFLAGCPDAGCKAYPTLAEAEKACGSMIDCGGITTNSAGADIQIRAGNKPAASPTHEISYQITNDLDCHVISDDASWTARGAAAYMGLNRSDPEAIWSFQGWAFVGWSSAKQASSLKSFIDATPKGKFNVIDMSVNGEGEWKKWNNASFWGANFVWTTLHDFGGTDGLKGDLSRINRIPFDAMAPTAETNVRAAGVPLGNLVPTLLLALVTMRVWGTGFTPEGIDQNPVYYEYMLDANIREAPIENITKHIVQRSHRRYGLVEEDPAVTTAWSLLVQSAYAQDLSVQDGTGVAHIGDNEGWAWAADRHTPSPTLCQIYNAWTALIDVSARVAHPITEPFRYDLVNTGREILAQVAGPAGANFTSALGAKVVNAEDISTTGKYYAEVLDDIDTLVGTDTAFMLGPWIEMARAFAANNTDCAVPSYPTITTCRAFYEWNARVQLTTWNPTPHDAAAVPGGPIDYASKHWSGLISDYYAERVRLLTAQGAKDAANGKPTPTAVANQIKADHAYAWTTATNDYPTTPTQDAITVSKQMQAKYAHFFTTC